MRAKKGRRAPFMEQRETGLRRWLQSSLRAPSLAWAIAFLLALGLALCEADLLVQLFWLRRLPVQLGLLIAGAVLQTPLLLGSVRDYLSGTQADSGPVRQLARWALGLGLGCSLLGLLWMAGNQLLSSLQTATSGQMTTAGQAVLDRGVEWTYLAALTFLLAPRGTRLLLKTQPPQERMRVAVHFLAAAFALVYLVNTLLPILDVRAGTFAAPSVVPTYSPAGMDFRRGVYLPAARLLSGENIYPAHADGAPNLYPPFVTLLGMAYVLMGEEMALQLHALLLFAANVICLVMAAMLWRRTLGRGKREEAGTPAIVDLPLLVLVGVGLFSGYPFLFSLERGNIDALAMVLAVAAYLVLAARPEQMWWQVVLLSLAIHIKAYPALLLLPLFIVHRRRMILPMALVNVALLLCLGPANAAGFVLSLLRFYEPIVISGNHSAYSFTGFLSQGMAATKGTELLLLAALTAAPLILWGIGLRAATHYRTASRVAAAGLVLTTPVMAVLPGISYDYQLVILYAPILLLLAMIVESMRRRHDPVDYVQLLLLVLAVGMIGRSYLIMHGVSPLLQNKYTWVILIQVVALVQVLREIGDTDGNRGARSVKRASVGQ
jgi:hypothetical protein